MYFYVIFFKQSADNPDGLKCKVCDGTYMVEKGSQFSLSKGFTAKQVHKTDGVIDAKY